MSIAGSTSNKTNIGADPVLAHGTMSDGLMDVHVRGNVVWLCAGSRWVGSPQLTGAVSSVPRGTILF
jgi:hypothetical protein